MSAVAVSPLKTAERRLLLLAAVRRQGGEWTPRRVQRLYLDRGLGGLHQSVWRGDLAALHTAGQLTLCETVGRRFYTVPQQGGAQ